MGKKQIVMYGGCFNPPHNIHFTLAQQIVDEYNEIEKIIFVPVNNKYQKIDLIGNEHRYQMLKLVCDKNEKFEVSRVEIDSTRPLYTIETLRKFQTRYSKHEIGFILGSDNLKELDTWQKAEELMKDFKIYVSERGKDTIDAIIASNELLKRYEHTFIKVKNGITSNLSSTLLRDKIRNEKSIKYLTPEEVRDYINKNKLYK